MKKKEQKQVARRNRIEISVRKLLEWSRGVNMAAKTQCCSNKGEKQINQGIFWRQKSKGFADGLALRNKKKGSIKFVSPGFWVLQQVCTVLCFTVFDHSDGKTRLLNWGGIGFTHYIVAIYFDSKILFSLVI